MSKTESYRMDEASADPRPPSATPTQSVVPSRKRRRPSGEKPPLPRPLQTTGKFMLGLTVLALFSWVMMIAQGTQSGLSAMRWDLSVLHFIEQYRTAWLTSLAQNINDVLVSDMTTRILRWATILALLGLRRFRHLLVYLGTILAVGFVTTSASLLIARPRPLGIEILDTWLGASHPSRPMAALAATLLGILYTLVVPGPLRDRGKWLAGALLILAGMARLYLGVEHPSDVVIGLVMGTSISVIAFRWLTPNDAFPVTYRSGRTAHLDIEGPRGEAIKRAVEEQLGLTVLQMKPFGLEGSGGSTPLRLTVAGKQDEPDAYLFAKLYAQNHLRADRWYKVGRTLLYGRLEDESPFNTVRRLVQYEDYLLRVMRDAGISVPRPYGVVEITPEREYIIVTDFVDGGKEIRDAEANDEIIHDGMRLVRQLWDAGVAHRDIKPSNLLMVGNKIHLIDVAFGEVRPSPWRQAVDLANMMLVLGLCSSPERVYQIALEYFTEDDIAEAFAATRSVTMPSQSRSMINEGSGGWLRRLMRRRAQDDLVSRFRALAHKRSPISIQRWSTRRVALMVGLLLSILLGVSLVFGNLRGAGLVGGPVETQASLSAVIRTPECGQIQDPLMLVSQSVPQASLVPCLAALPVGWHFRAVDVDSDSSHFFVDYDRISFGSMIAAYQSHCDVSRSIRATSDKAATKMYQRTTSLDESYVGTRTYVFDGGCLEFSYDFRGEGRTALADEITDSFGFVERTEINQLLRDSGITP